MAEASKNMQTVKGKKLPAQPGQKTNPKIKVDSQKVCNEKIKAHQDGEKVLDFSAHMEAVRPCFNKFGQHEPATVRIKNIITQYVGDRDGCGIEELIKELLQNSDDSQATEIHFVLDNRTLPNSRVWKEWKSMQGPALCVHNNSVFTEKDIESIQKLGVGSKSIDPDKTGQFGIGFNVVYQLTDCPILLSDHKDICMFDPHLKYVPGACDERPGGHVDLQQDTNFAKLFPDFMAGFLRGQVSHAGSTIFRLPLRQPNANSQICDMTFSPPDVEAMEATFQSVEFRMFLHSSLLFTKHLGQVTVSVMGSDGKLQKKVEVRRLMPHSKQQQLASMQKKLLYECKLLAAGKIKPQQVTTGSLSYSMQTEDDYLKNDWFINQTFGLHGLLNAEDYKFLLSFYGEESKKFLPIAGIATKLHTKSLLSSHVYSFLPLPIKTGLPVHINGHFAIHSSRRSIWEHTSFGKWNRVLHDYIIGPAYCHLLMDFSKEVRSPADVKRWLRILPEMVKAKDEYFASLVGRVYEYMVEADLPIVPVSTQDGTISFCSPNKCLFSPAQSNQVVEAVLLKLNQKVCIYSEVGLKFKMATINKLKFINSVVVLDCLKSLNLQLPQPLSKTAFTDTATLNTMLGFILGEVASRDYGVLEGAPLCLTSDLTLRLFSTSSPVFIDSEYSSLLPELPHMFLHADVASNFSFATNQKPSGPIRSLNFAQLGELLPATAEYMDYKWTKQLWAFVKTHAIKSEITQQLSPLLHLPLVPLSDGRVVSLKDASQILSMAEASKNMQTVTEAMGVLRLNPTLLSDEKLTKSDINHLSTPFMLNGALPSSFLKAIDMDNTCNVKKIKMEHAEILLQYLNLDHEAIKSDVDLQKTTMSLPIFEDVDGIYKSLKDNSGVILDSCIPTHGVAQWMEKSHCILLKEKTVYNTLYEAIGLEKKNAVEVYLDDIFPSFQQFDAELRLAHLASIRTSVLPLLEAYADSATQERFWSRLQLLPCIPYKMELLPASHFKDPEVELLSLLPHLHTLPLMFADDEWLPFLRKAGLKVSITECELLQCADAVTNLTTAEFSETKAKLILETASNGTFSKETLKKLCEIKFIPQDSVPVDSTLIELSPSVISSTQYMSLQQALMYENDKHRHVFRHCVLCWTTRTVLPNWAVLSTDLSEIAAAESQPTVADVCQHMKNLCDSLPDKISLSTFKSFRKVVHYCLDYLQNPCKCMKRKCDNCAVIKSLKHTPFICVKNRHLRVKPTQVILHMPADIDADLLYPYVFNRPTDMAKYDDLLHYIGAASTPSPDLYAEILHSLWLDFGSSHTLQTNDKQTASLAVYGLFTSLCQQGQRLTMQPLCLPSDKALMSLSTELVVPDSESLVKTIKDRGYQYMCSLSSCSLTKPAKELIFYLPEAVRPKLLSQLVKEQVVVNTPCDLSLDCPFYGTYEARLHSDKFKQALWLISRVSENKRDEFSNDLGRLKLVEVTCFHHLYGYLSEQGRTLENSMIEKITHVENTLGSAKLYIQHCDAYPGIAALVNEVAAAIKSIVCYNENYYIDSGAIVDLLNCASEEDIDQYLIEQGLNTREDDMSRPKPGTIISKDVRDLFLYNPDMVFQPKEYVGYAMKNGEDLIYAKVIRETEQGEGEEIKPILRVYDIDTGRGYPVQVNSTDLFKESRRQSFDECRQIMISNKKSPAHSAKQGNAIVEEAKRTVTKLLNEVYSDPTLWKQRDKVKKMLLLKWHPDKAGDSILANEVFKHLKSEIDRVEEKYSLSDDEDSVEEQVYEWEEVDANHKPPATKKDQTDQLADSESAAMKGDIEAAQPWLKQAECDLVTAQHLIDANTGYEWAAHICCEVIRKLMVGTIIAKQDITTELESTRLNTKLFETIRRIPNAPSDQLAVHLMELNKLKVDETTTRQPGTFLRNAIPSQVFDKEICMKVKDLTIAIKSLLSEFLNNSQPMTDANTSKD